jgi:UDP-3-O-[3-hydroxymyristoyl] N-acetylglucosamine deacetylase
MTHKTIKEKITFVGIGIHSGNPVTMTIHPSSKNQIIFYNLNNPSKKLVVAPKNCSAIHNRATYLKNNTMTIQTPEHFLAACAAFNISSLDIFIDSPELPIFDGSSSEFINAFSKNKIINLETKNSPIKIKKPKLIQHNQSCIILTPSKTSIFNYYLSYNDKHIKTQIESISINKKIYLNDLFSARTFGFEEEVDHLKKQGLAKGGSLKNALIIGKNSYVNEPRFPNECAKHKLLDLIGDLWILNKPIIGTITAIKSGHQLNNECIHYLNSLI